MVHVPDFPYKFMSFSNGCHNLKNFSVAELNPILLQALSPNNSCSKACFWILSWSVFSCNHKDFLRNRSLNKFCWISSNSSNLILRPYYLRFPKFVLTYVFFFFCIKSKTRKCQNILDMIYVSIISNFWTWRLMHTNIETWCLAK